VRLQRGLQKVDQCDSMSIATLSSLDTVPLGTDLDPRNQYNNLWAAGKVRDLTVRRLVQCNLSCRVLDAENIGFSHGELHLGRPKFYSYEGVKTAVSYFLKEGLEVILVSKRKTEAKNFEASFGVHTVIADRTDDLIVLKQAYKRNCPIVSRDSYTDWRTDRRIERDLRKWAEDTKDLQVRFTWSPEGEFCPDFDLPPPLLGPASSKASAANTEAPPRCQQCGQNDAQGRWGHWKQGWHFFCKACWDEWERKA